MTGKIAVVVEPHFLERHNGVRNLMLAVRRLLGRVARTDLISFYRCESGRRQWYRLALRDERFAAHNGILTNRVYRGSPEEALAAWKADQTADAPPASDTRAAFTHFGPDIETEGYATAVIASPWVMNVDDRLPFPDQYGVAYDIIPNRYVLTNTNKPWVFAHEHVRGYAYFKRHCRATFPISPRTGEELVNFFGFDPKTTIALPPVLPAAYFDPPPAGVRRDRTLVLAAPFDKRKGLKILPALVNRAAGAIDRLAIYGAPRCDPADVDEFFEKLDPKLRVRWYARATAETVRKLFARGRVLLFPSYEEGLGLPLVEAQYLGCRVLARPMDPMGSLMLDGSVTLTGDTDAELKTAGDAVAAALADDRFRHDELQRAAEARFSPENLLRVLCDTMGLQPARRLAA